jgi:hypothetical protein
MLDESALMYAAETQRQSISGAYRTTVAKPSLGRFLRNTAALLGLKRMGSWPASHYIESELRELGIGVDET